jgi:hypothetical protein
LNATLLVVLGMVTAVLGVGCGETTTKVVSQVPERRPSTSTTTVSQPQSAATGGTAATATGGTSASATGGTSASATGGTSASATGGTSATTTGGTAATPGAAAAQEPREVPKETNLRLVVAEKDLERRGVPYRVVGAGYTSSSRKSEWIVCETNPTARTHLESGTTIRLIVGRSCRAGTP